ncbi:Ig-like domain-containing protein [Roseivirga pacifica]|uniref:Ig-like domain-containing protein n=1 Tax=Roseivirga pacifica TaxID=1267423 RepID=A0A1I0MWQ2_9BACT|nr:Ig-like domain-containing protein [Roseivirga pacifica]RKQ50738.1 Ig-like domain-containing protein [Roseivirga pacifica]SEV92816.1 Ig-like domain-containing protein [Roseivirga pacifica]
MIKRYSLYIGSVILLTLASCARVSSPTGGDEDEIPPTLIRSVPEPNQLNYHGDVIMLEFDEMVQTNQIESNLIITPKIEGSFRTKVNKTTVTLTFQEPLKDSTTYSLNFGNTIQDITNRNVPPNLSLSFSTGDYLDSLRITGSIVDLYSQDPIEDVLVTLYSDEDTTNILNGSASYYTKTDTAGLFTFNNLPSKNFRIYAVEDENGNSKADSDGEAYGFYPDTLKLNSNINNVNFSIQKLNTKDLRLISGRHFATYYELTFNKAVDSFKLVNPATAVYNQITPDKIRFYQTTEAIGDTTQMIFEATDSLSVTLLDTANYYFSESEIEPKALSTEIFPKTSSLKPNQEIRLRFDKPIKDFLPDSAFYYIDSTNIVSLKNTAFAWNYNRTEITWPINITDYITEPQQTLKLQLRPQTFISYDLDTTKLIEKPFTIANKDEAAIIRGSVTSTSDNIIVQLLNASNLNVISETTNKQFVFDYLPAGKYMVRVIEDLNQNGKWDIGNILTNTPPEPVTFYFDTYYKTSEIEVRKFWERDKIDILLR